MLRGLWKELLDLMIWRPIHEYAQRKMADKLESLGERTLEDFNTLVNCVEDLKRRLNIARRQFSQ